MAKKYYGIVIENENFSTVVTSWAECLSITKGKKARYKSFSTEKLTMEWINSGGLYEDKKSKIKELKTQLEDGIYFDAGTGRGIGVEVRVTNVFGESLLHEIMPDDMINSFGNYVAPDGSTNNYGELIGMYLAIDIAKKLNIKKIFGDSKLVIDFWSKGICNKDKLPEKTVEIIFKTTKKRKDAEKNAFTINHVSGDINPADLGFHK